ncbi:RNA polymerase sigma-70 factor (ECF subfamily) [Streptomyces sp. 3330]|uniref:sigma-70 family RNA polymerase sigma factor n=1 Tax=Streptomyces sp. 3330 TaxID=2817755 RepID=UPI00285B59DC|nr:sigma-70 family RNA polymerase sigma factor [Streptomyces sp. 3330]MDR6981208.1 RNA polymerase sigma-70 factor (ECF subfamily) [Streptomyces sp. 3330]
MSWTFMGSDGSSTPAAEQDRADHQKQVLALHAYVSRLLRGDPVQAEDIVQETLLRCWRTYGCTGNAVLRPWMFRVARNLVIDGYRSSKTRPQEVDGALWMELEAAELDASEEVLTAMVVRDGLATLSAAHRQALFEVYFRGLTLEEAAHVLGVPKGTLKSRVHYGLQALQKVLNHACV